jgi:hypothetical protein
LKQWPAPTGPEGTQLPLRHCWPGWHTTFLQGLEAMQTPLEQVWKGGQLTLVHLLTHWLLKQE